LRLRHERTQASTIAPTSIAAPMIISFAICKVRYGEELYIIC
jgi:hypothetical protein